RHAPRLSHGGGGDALLEPRRQQVLLGRVHVHPGAVDQGHAVRHQGAHARGLPEDRRRARVLRRLRPVRRLRSVVRGGARRAEDRRGARALPRADVRRHEDRPLPARLAAAAHDSAGVRQVQVDGVMPLFPRAYALARRAGLVDRPWFDAVFSRSYFLYKRWLEDPFHGLARRSPELFRGGPVVDVAPNIAYTPALFPPPAP